MGERVATVDLKRILTNVVLRRDDVGWGPNSTFRFPAHGGTGAIWRAVAARLPAAQIHFRRTVSQVDLEKKRLTMADGESIGYDVLISTIPLDHLLRSIHGRPELTQKAPQFVYSSSHIVGIGMTGTQPADLRTKCWIYFPEDKVPFYRATVFSNYSPNNVPTSSPHWSLMAEVSESPDKPVKQETLIARHRRLPRVRVHRSSRDCDVVASAAGARLPDAMARAGCGARPDGRRCARPPC